ncbi:MAG: carbohydrate kinase family protein [Deltaproteobacteria bacterium]
MFDVVGIGLNAVDYLVGLPRFPVPGEKLRMSAFAREGGGQVATALVALSRWGCRCKYVGNVGDDEHGRLSSLLLSREGIDLAHVRTVSGASSQFAVILVEEKTGERTILWDRDPRIRVSQDDLPLDDIRQARALLLDGHDIPPAIAAAKAARAAGVPVVLDAEKVQEGTEELLSVCDHIVAAGHFPGLLFPGTRAEDGAREILRRYGSRTSTVTLGARGAYGCDAREEIFSASIRIEARDTTGAGDIFHAGFLYALLEGLPFREILAFANAAAGLSCRGMGGRSAIPTVGEIRAASASSGR